MLEALPAAVLYGVYKLARIVASDKPEQEQTALFNAELTDTLHKMEHLTEKAGLSEKDLQLIADFLLELQDKKMHLQGKNFYFYFIGDKLKIEKVQEY